MPLITKAMEDEEESLTKKFAEGGMTVTTEQPADIEAGTKVDLCLFGMNGPSPRGPTRSRR